MIRSLLAIGLLCGACSGSSDASRTDGSAGSTGSSGGASNAGNASSAGSPGNYAGSTSSADSCPDLSGSWDVTAHCDQSLIGMTLQVTESACSLSFAAPFNAFSGSVTADGTITLSGPQNCTGTATASAVSMNCTPGTCVVKLAR